MLYTKQPQREISRTMRDRHTLFLEEELEKSYSIIRDLQYDLQVAKETLERQSKELQLQNALHHQHEQQFKEEQLIYQKEMRALQSIVLDQTRRSRAREKIHLRGRNALLGRIQLLQDILVNTAPEEDLKSTTRKEKEKEPRPVTPQTNIHASIGTMDSNINKIGFPSSPFLPTGLDYVPRSPKTLKPQVSRSPNTSKPIIDEKSPNQQGQKSTKSLQNQQGQKSTKSLQKQQGHR